MIGKIWILKYFILSMIFSLSVIVFNYNVDSYGVFKSDYSKLYREPNQNFIKMDFLLTKQHAFDSFIFGASRVGHISPKEIENGNYYNLSYSEGLPVEHLANIKLLIKNHIPIKNILIGLDDFSYELNPLHHITSPMQYPHYDTQINHMSKVSFYIQYLFKKPSNFDITRVAKQLLSGKTYETFDYDIYNTGLPIVPDTITRYIEENQEEHNHDPKFLEPSHYEGDRIKETIEDIKKIVALSVEHKFKLIIFINPIHQVTYLDTNFKNFQLFKKELAEITNYYDFSGLNTITTNNYYFYETSHYRNLVGEMIKKRIFNNANENFGIHVSKSNINEHLQNLKQQIEDLNVHRLQQ